MKKLEMYQCECCGTQYASEAEAEKCESHHQKPVEIVGVKFNNYKNSYGSRYPMNVTLKFEDGEELEYKN